MQVRREGEWLSARVDDQLVMMSVEQGCYVGLSEVGARIWELIEQPSSVDDLCNRLQAEYDVAPEVCRSEVLAFLSEMQAQGALSVTAQ